MSKTDLQEKAWRNQRMDLNAINDSLRAYRELLPLLHEPSNIKQVTDAIKHFESLKASL